MANKVVMSCMICQKSVAIIRTLASKFADTITMADGKLELEEYLATNISILELMV